ncbi:MAG: hypothetical protein ABIQ96_22020 [Luteolibacter sp.]
MHWQIAALVLHAIFKGFLFGDALLGGVLADVLADFHRAAGKSLGWQEGDHGLGWVLASGGLEGNGEVEEKKFASFQFAVFREEVASEQ